MSRRARRQSIRRFVAHRIRAAFAVKRLVSVAYRVSGLTVSERGNFHHVHFAVQLTCFGPYSVGAWPNLSTNEAASSLAVSGLTVSERGLFAEVRLCFFLQVSGLTVSERGFLEAYAPVRAAIAVSGLTVSERGLKGFELIQWESSSFGPYSVGAWLRRIIWRQGRGAWFRALQCRSVAA